MCELVYLPRANRLSAGVSFSIFDDGSCKLLFILLNLYAYIYKYPYIFTHTRTYIYIYVCLFGCKELVSNSLYLTGRNIHVRP